MGAPGGRQPRRGDRQVRRTEPYGSGVDVPSRGAGEPLPEGVPDGVHVRGAGAHAGELRDRAEDALDEVSEERDFVRAGHGVVRATRRLDVPLRGGRPREHDAGAGHESDEHGWAHEAFRERERRRKALAGVGRARVFGVPGGGARGVRERAVVLDVRPRLRRRRRRARSRDAARPDALAPEISERRLLSHVETEPWARPRAGRSRAAVGLGVEHSTRADRAGQVALGRHRRADAQVVRPAYVRLAEPRGDHDAARRVFRWGTATGRTHRGRVAGGRVGRALFRRGRRRRREWCRG